MLNTLSYLRFGYLCWTVCLKNLPTLFSSYYILRIFFLYLDTSPRSGILVVNIFSQWTIFSFSDYCFLKKQFLKIFIKSNLSCFSFIVYAFASYLRNLCLTPVTNICPCNSFKNLDVRYIIATSYMWLFKFQLITMKSNLKFTSLVALAKFQALNSPM